MRDELRRPFLVVALPRSRTYWMSRYLAYKGGCYHDVSRFWRTKNDAKEWLVPGTGLVDTALILILGALRKRVPRLKVVAVVRPIQEVLESLERVGIRDAKQAILLLSECLTEALPSADLVLQYGDLQTVAGRRALFETCVERGFDPVWDEYMNRQRLVCDVDLLMKQASHNPHLHEVFAKEFV